MAQASPFVLPEHCIHVWWASLDRPAAQIAAWEDWLAADERARAGAFQFAHLRSRYIAGRAMLRQLLAYYVEGRPEALMFDYGAQGKPFLTLSARHVQFNLAHADGMVVYAVGRTQDATPGGNNGGIGVDVERIRPMPDYIQIAQQFFSASEVKALQALSAAEQVAGFFATWTRKEAFIKALGTGLSYPLDSFAVTVDPRQPAALVAVAGDPAALGRWKLIDLAAPAGWRAALAVTDPRVTVVEQHFEVVM